MFSKDFCGEKKSMNSVFFLVNITLFFNVNNKYNFNMFSKDFCEKNKNHEFFSSFWWILLYFNLNNKYDFNIFSKDFCGEKKGQNSPDFWSNNLNHQIFTTGFQQVVASQNIKEFWIGFLLSCLIYSQIWLNLLVMITHLAASQNWEKQTPDQKNLNVFKHLVWQMS
jgi:hypothetical protein